MKTITIEELDRNHKELLGTKYKIIKVPEAYVLDDGNPFKLGDTVEMYFNSEYTSLYAEFRKLDTKKVRTVGYTMSDGTILEVLW